MTTATHTVPRFAVRFATYRGLLLAALCVFIATAFLIDVQRGASRLDAPTTVEQRS